MAVDLLSCCRFLLLKLIFLRIYELQHVVHQNRFSQHQHISGKYFSSLLMIKTEPFF